MKLTLRLTLDGLVAALRTRAFVATEETERRELAARLLRVENRQGALRRPAGNASEDRDGRAGT